MLDVGRKLFMAGNSLQRNGKKAALCSVSGYRIVCAEPPTARLASERLPLVGGPLRSSGDGMGGHAHAHHSVDRGCGSMCH